MTPPTLQIWFDPVCPWCFIGHARLARAQAALGDRAVPVAWRPFQLAPEVPAGGVPRKAYFAAKFGGGERADAAWVRVSAAGQAEGVRFDFEAIALEPNTLDAHRSVRFAARQGRADPLIEALFIAHFQRGLDIGDQRVLADLADGAGLDGRELRAHLATGADAAETRAEAERSRRLGVRGVPSYGVEDRLLPAEAAADLGRLIERLATTAA